MSVLTQGKTGKRAKPHVLADLMRLAVPSSFTDNFWLYINL